MSTTWLFDEEIFRPNRRAVSTTSIVTYALLNSLTLGQISKKFRTQLHFTLNHIYVYSNRYQAQN